MKTLISFVVVSLLGFVFSLDGASKDREVAFASNLLSAETTEYAYEISYLFELNDESNLLSFKDNVVEVIRKYSRSLEKIGYTVQYNEGGWSTDANRYVFSMYWVTYDRELAEITLRRCVQNVGSYVLAEVSGIERMWGAINWNVFELYR